MTATETLKDKLENITSCSGLTLTTGQMPTQLLSHSPSPTEQGRKQVEKACGSR